MKKSPTLSDPPPIVEADFISSSGVPQRVLIPQGETNLATGIPVSLDLSPLYSHMPEDFLRELTKSCHAVGLVKPIDYLSPEAGQRFRAAMLSVIKRDFSNVMALAKEELDARK
jgi:hypothetical protein